MSKTIGLTCDLRKDYLAEGCSEEAVAEFDSEETVEAIESALSSLGYRTDRIGNARSLCSRLVNGDRWDLVFNIAEGLHGRSREAQAPCLLELYDVPYTFSDPLVCAVTLDKAAAKRLVRSFAVPTPDFLVVHDDSDLDRGGMSFPVFVKPVAEGTGKGIDGRSCVASASQLKDVCLALLERFRQPVLVEEFLPGREFTVGILGTGRSARTLGAMEIEILNASGDGVYSLEAKEACEQCVRYSSPPAGELRREVEALALQVCRALECRDAARADFRLDRQGRPQFLEINPLPGLHPHHSDLPMIANQEGMPYEELIETIVNSAFARAGEERCVAGRT